MFALAQQDLRLQNWVIYSGQDGVSREIRCCYMLLHDVGRDMMKCSASPGRWPKAPLGDVSFDDEEDRRNALELLGHETKRIDQ